MIDRLSGWLLDPSGLTPHGFCLLWQPWLIWTHALADVGIGLAYFSIPLALLVFARRRRDLVFRPVFWLFAAFILLCGTGHWLDLLTLWVPAYSAKALVKAATAMVSLATAAALWPLMPRALALPSGAQLQAANDALRASEARHRANFIGAPVPLHVLDTAGRIIEVSDRWLDLLGYRRDEVIGRAVGDFQDDGGAAARSVLGAVLAATAELRDAPRRFVRRDGAVLDVLVSARVEREADGTPTHVITALVDVTARRRAEAALAESERNFRLLVEGVTDHAIYMLGPDGTVANWNPGACRIKGYTAAEAIGQHVSRFCTEEDRAAGVPERALAAAARDGRHEEEGWRVRKDGGRFWASVVLHALRGEDGTLLGFAKVTRDITERREAQRALEAAREQLAQAQKMEAIGQLTGGLAHDFNNVLQAVTGNLELIRRRLREERPDVARLADNALDASGKAARLTAQLLAFARRQALDPRPLDPVEVVEGLRALLARTAGDRIALRVEADEGVGLCLADRNQLESALLNLAINARDAIGPAASGTIAVSLRAVRITTNTAGGLAARRRVRPDRGARRRPGDAGGSAPPRLQAVLHHQGTRQGNGARPCPDPRLRPPVGRHGHDRQRPGRGHGGGAAAAARRRGRSHGGAAGRGGRRYSGPAGRRGNRPARGGRRAGPRRAGRDPARPWLPDRRGGRRGRGAHGPGRRAVVDVVLTDLTMPGSMDGLGFAGVARAWRPGLPVVLITGHLVPLHGGRRLPEGIGFVPKPHRRGPLAAALRRALGKETAAAGASAPVATA